MLRISEAVLPYTAEVLFAVFDEYNQAIRPLQGMALLLAASALAFSCRAEQDRTHFITGILALGWVWTGTAWHIGYFSGINFAASGYGALFILQGLLLAWAGCARRSIHIRFRGDVRSWSGLVIALVSAGVVPVLDVLAGTGWTDARFVLVSPSATAGFTVGLLLLAQGRSLRFLMLMLVPTLWLLAAGIRAWVLDIPQDYLFPLAAIVALVLTVTSFRGTPRTEDQNQL